MVVRTEQTNGRAIAFYEGRGFARVGEAADRVGTIDVPVLELAAMLR